MQSGSFGKLGSRGYITEVKNAKRGSKCAIGVISKASSKMTFELTVGKPLFDFLVKQSDCGYGKEGLLER